MNCSGVSAAEVLDDAVVREDLDLVVRKRDRKHVLTLGAVAERLSRRAALRISSRARAALAAR